MATRPCRERGSLRTPPAGSAARRARSRGGKWNAFWMLGEFSGESKINNTGRARFERWRDVAFIEECKALDGGRRSARRGNRGRRRSRISAERRGHPGPTNTMAFAGPMSCTLQSTAPRRRVGCVSYRKRCSGRSSERWSCRRMFWTVVVTAYGRARRALDERNTMRRRSSPPCSYDRLKDDQQPACAQARALDPIEIGEHDACRRRAGERLERAARTRAGRRAPRPRGPV